jgi:hypothetical protein
MATPSDVFFSSVLSAGAILSGFCGTFLVFRLQREATYYRQPVVDYVKEKGKDVFIGKTHFSSAFLLLLLATLCSATFGFVFPLLALSGSTWIVARPGLVVGGVIGALLLVGAYFLDELIHYEILKKLPSDSREWKREWWVVLLGAVLAGVSVYWFGFGSG